MAPRERLNCVECVRVPVCVRLLNRVTFDVLRSVVFFYIKTPLRVKEAGLEELIPTTWWPTRFDKEVTANHRFPLKRLPPSQPIRGFLSHATALCFSVFVSD